MATSIDDVADRAGVSVATVSRALRGLPNVAPGTRERVVRAARELQYVASPSASRLAARRTSTVAVLLPSLATWYASQILDGVYGVFEASAYDVLLHRVPTAESRDAFVEAMPFRKRADALLIVDVPMGRDQLEALTQPGPAIVTVGFHVDGFSAVLVDDRGAARSATRHLTSLGHRRVALIGPGADHELAPTWASGRRQGFADALERAGVAHDADLDVAVAPTALAGAEAMAKLLARRTPPTAVFALTDELAIGALQAAEDAGWAVPGDLSIVGFDDHELSEFVGLTTVRRDVDELGARAALTLLEHLADPGAQPVTHVQPSRLVVRHTTDEPPTS